LAPDQLMVTIIGTFKNEHSCYSYRFEWERDIYYQPNPSVTLMKLMALRMFWVLKSALWPPNFYFRFCWKNVY